MLDYLQKSKLFILTTHYEGFGMALLESSISGVKVITTDLPVLREVLRSRDVDFVEENNVKSLAETIEHNFNNHVSKSASSSIEKYGWKRAARNFKWCYMEQDKFSLSWIKAREKYDLNIEVIFKRTI